MKVRLFAVLVVLALVATDSRADWWPGKALGRSNPRGREVSPARQPIAPYNANFAFPATNVISTPPVVTTPQTTQDYKLTRVCGENGCQIVRVPVTVYTPQTITPKLAPVVPVAVKIQ